MDNVNTLGLHNTFNTLYTNINANYARDSDRVNQAAKRTSEEIDKLNKEKKIANLINKFVPNDYFLSIRVFADYNKAMYQMDINELENIRENNKKNEANVINLLKRYCTGHENAINIWNGYQSNVVNEQNSFDNKICKYISDHHKNRAIQLKKIADLAFKRNPSGIERIANEEIQELTQVLNKWWQTRDEDQIRAIAANTLDTYNTKRNNLTKSAEYITDVHNMIIQTRNPFEKEFTSMPNCSENNRNGRGQFIRNH